MQLSEPGVVVVLNKGFVINFLTIDEVEEYLQYLKPEIARGERMNRGEEEEVFQSEVSAIKRFA